MKKIQIFLIFFLFTIVLHAQGKSWWQYGGNDAGVTAASLALAYQTRVVADGGTIVDLDSVTNAYQSALDNETYNDVVCWIASNFGVKKDANDKLTKLYDLSTNNNDLAQSDTSKAPTWYADSIEFDGTNDYMQVLYVREDPLTFFVVFQVKVIPGSNSVILDGGAANELLIYYTPAGAPIIRPNPLSPFIQGASGLVVDWGVYLIMGIINVTSSLGRLNAVAFGGTSLPAINDYQGLTIGADGGGSGTFANINILEFKVMSVALDATAYQADEAYLNLKWTIY